VDCDHIGRKSWKLIPFHRQLARHLRSLQRKGDPPTPRGTWGNFGETKGGVGKKWCDEEQSDNIFETRKDKKKNYYGRQKIGRPIGTHQRFFDPLPHLPQDWGSQPLRKTAIENRGKTSAHR